jgi:hypothetical protein
LASLEGRRDRKPADSRTRVDASSHAWACQAGADALLRLHVVPGAKVAAVRGRHGERFKIAIDAPPADGKANEALLDFLAVVTATPRRRIHLYKGATSRDKTVRIEGADAAAVAQRLLVRSPVSGRK